uniref:Uncharacterized protein n=1 Tax=Rhizochromulina marina TaxID=1034831 RepID=A0A7S2W1I1_9STRA
MAAEEPEQVTESMEVDGPEPPCPVCGEMNVLTPTVSTVGLHVIRLLSKGMKDKVDALLESRGLHLPEPGEKGATPLSIKCCDRCYRATAAAKKHARSQSSWLPHLDDGQFPQHTMRVNGKQVTAYMASPGDVSFVLKAGATARELLTQLNKGNLVVTATTLGEPDYMFQRDDRVWFPSLTSPGLRPCPAGFGRVVACAMRKKKGTVEEEYSIQPEAPGESVQVRIGTSLHRVTEEQSPRSAKRQCVKQRPDPVDVDKLIKDNRQMLRRNEELTAEVARLRANLHAQEQEQGEERSFGQFVLCAVTCAVCKRQMPEPK